MCGIVGYLGQKEPVGLIIDSLRQLEYRGYDSAGLALLNKDGQLDVYKATGKLSNLENHLQEFHPEQSLPNGGRPRLGIGHIRWATHGGATHANAHPHVDAANLTALVHNGIIENHAEVRKALVMDGCTFNSETDTECVVQLMEAEAKRLEEAQKNEQPAKARKFTEGNRDAFVEAALSTLPQLEGAWALAFVSTRQPNHLYAARRKSPLVIGVIGDLQNPEDGLAFMVASDTVALANQTNKVIFLHDDEFAELRPDGMTLWRWDGEHWHTVSPRVDTIQTGPLLLDKKGFRHYMMKEIHEQPDVLRNAMAERLTDVSAPVSLFSEAELDKLATARRIVIIGCGTSYNAGLVGKYALEALTGIPTEVEAAGEYRYRDPVLDADTLLVVISQSGETADSLEAFRQAKKRHGVRDLVVTNREDSTLAREASCVVPVRAGIEVSVCATKSFLAQVMALYLLAMSLAERRKTVDKDTLARYKTAMLRLPAQLEAILADEEPIQAMAKKLTSARNVLFIARGFNFPVALEGALKLKEISYIHAEGYSGSELKHGPIAMLDETLPVIAVLTPGPVYEKMLSNCQEAAARDARMYAVSAELSLSEHHPDLFEGVLTIPTTEEWLSPLLTTVPLQLLAYHMAVHLGKDVDQPRNLAKSVTVE